MIFLWVFNCLVGYLSSWLIGCMIAWLVDDKFG